MSKHRRRPVPSHRRNSGAFHLGRAAARLVLVCLGGLIAAGLLPFAVGGTATVVVSGSMTPTIRPGDVALALPIAATQAAPGHVIMFDSPARPGTTVIHRVVSINADGTFITRGDANAAADSTPVPARAIHGRVVGRVPFIGLPKFWLETGQLTPIVATAVLLVLLVFAYVDDPSPRRPERGDDHRTASVAPSDVTTGRWPVDPGSGRRLAARAKSAVRGEPG